MPPPPGTKGPLDAPGEAAASGPIEKATLAPARPRTIPKAVLEQQRVISGARRPGEPPPAPPPPRAATLPKLPPPPTGGPTALPPPPPAEDEDVEVDVAPLEERAPAEPLRTVPTTAAITLPAICTYGRFEILGRVAFGGMAEIFLGREGTRVGASRLLAIKRILPHVADDPQFVEMFLDEARLAIQLNHPFICHIYEFGELEGTYFIAMEWIHGAQLGKIIRRARTSGGIPPELGARIIACVAEALHYAHRARDANGTPLGIVHRDVSPHNVMVSYDGQVKLLDFGIAKAGSHTTKTQAGVIKGKFSYMSPQQCLGKEIDARADVFALGICLYEILTGETLYQRSTEYETMRAVIEDPVPSIRDVRPDLPVELDAIVQKALQKQPQDRFRSAGEMQGALEDFLARTGRAVTTARIGDLMERLFEDQILAGPLVDSTPFGQSFRRRPARGEPGSSGVSSAPGVSGVSGVSGVVGAPPAAPLDVPPAPPPRRVWIPIAGTLAVLAIAGAIGAVALSQSTGGEPTAAPISASAPTPATAPAPTPATAPAPATDPAPAPEPVASPGTIRVRVAQRGATVRVGERTLTDDELGDAIQMQPGTYLVHIEHPDLRPWDDEVEVRPGETTDVEPTLVPRERAPAAPPGRISINTRPWSKVYVGARLLGTTPIGEAQVPSGNVRLRLVDRDGRTFSRSVRVPAGGAETVFYDLDAP